MQKNATLNGEKIAYSDIGRGQPIVCIHGWAMNKGMFSGLAEAMSGTFRIISIDLAGHGSSADAGGLYTVERAADDVFLLCEMLGLTNIIGLGWSMGMHVWWEMIERHGEDRLSGLVSEDMSPKVYNTYDWSLGTINGRTIDGLDEMLIDMCKDWTTFSYRFVPRIFANGLGDKWAELADRIMRGTLKNDPEIMAYYWRSMANKDYRELLPHLKTPTLIVRGALSQLYGQGVANYLEQNLQNSQLFSFAQSGHAPHLEQPEIFTEMLANFARDNQKSVETPMKKLSIKKGNHHVQL